MNCHSKIDVLDFVISVLKDHEEELSRLEDRFERVVDTLAKIVAVTDDNLDTILKYYREVGK